MRRPELPLPLPLTPTLPLPLPLTPTLPLTLTLTLTLTLHQWKNSHDERTRRASRDEARERVQNSDEAESAAVAAAESAELGAPPPSSLAAGARALL